MDIEQPEQQKTEEKLPIVNLMEEIGLIINTVYTLGQQIKVLIDKKLIDYEKLNNIKAQWESIINNKKYKENIACIDEINRQISILRGNIINLVIFPILRYCLEMGNFSLSEEELRRIFSQLFKNEWTEEKRENFAKALKEFYQALNIEYEEVDYEENDTLQSFLVKICETIAQKIIPELKVETSKGS